MLANGTRVRYARLFLALTACRISDQNALISNNAIQAPSLPDLQKISIWSIRICILPNLGYFLYRLYTAIHTLP